MTRTAGGAVFSLVEVLVALFLLGVGVLAAVPLFVHAIQGNAVGADLGTVGAEAVDRLERLRATPYDQLPAGGSLTSDVSGYSDGSDPSRTVRWTITDNTTPAFTKTITVRAIAARTVVGQRKEITLTTLRSR